MAFLCELLLTETSGGSHHEIGHAPVSPISDNSSDLIGGLHLDNYKQWSTLVKDRRKYQIVNIFHSGKLLEYLMTII